MGISVRHDGKIKCPFHDDTHPSCQLGDQTQSYYCFTCHIGGDAIGFVKRYLNTTPQGAAIWITDYYGVTPEKPKTLREYKMHKDNNAATKIARNKKRAEKAWVKWAWQALTSRYLTLMHTVREQWEREETTLNYYMDVLWADSDGFCAAYGEDLTKYVG